MVRIGIALSDAGHKRLVELTEKTQAGSQTALVESLLFGLSDDEAVEVVTRGNARREDDAKRLKEMKKQAREAINNLSAEQIEALLKQAAQNKAEESKES